MLLTLNVECATPCLFEGIYPRASMARTSREVPYAGDYDIWRGVPRHIDEEELNDNRYSDDLYAVPKRKMKSKRKKRSSRAS